MRVNFAVLGFRVSFSLRRQERYTAARLAEMAQSGGLIVCTSRCLYCGRQTPHEVCHAHSERTSPGWSGDAGEFDLDALWGIYYDAEPEMCTDPECLSWEPKEAEQMRERRRFAEVVG